MITAAALLFPALVAAAPAQSLPDLGSLLGRGFWTLDPGPFPAGVLALAVGPEEPGGRAVVALSVLAADEVPLLAPSAGGAVKGAGGEDRTSALAQRLAARGVVLDELRVGPAITSGSARIPDRERLVVRFFLLPTEPARDAPSRWWLVTLVAPKETIRGHAARVEKRLQSALPSTRK
jgi:hypothetical protein